MRFKQYMEKYKAVRAIMEAINIGRDKFTLNMDIVKNYDDSPMYLNMVQDQVDKGNGLVTVRVLKPYGMAQIVGAGSMSDIYQNDSYPTIAVPVMALIKADN